MATTTEGDVIGDVIVRELDKEMSRETLTVLASNTFVFGQIGCIDNAGKVNTIANAQDDVYTLTAAAGTDGGTYKVVYRGDSSASIDWNESNANLQTEIRALHNDLDSCVVAGTAGTVQTVTVPHEKKSNMFHLAVGFDITADGGVWEGGYTCDRTTYAEQCGVIALEAVADSSYKTGAFLVRDAIVDVANLTGGSADIYIRLAEPKVADDFEAQTGYGKILARTGPTFTTLPIT